MRLGIDIDGVVCDSYPFWLGELNRHYGKEIQELHDYEMHLIFDVPWEDMNKFFIENVERLFMEPVPMPGAQKALQALSKEHDIILVTARREVEEDITLDWLKLHQIPFSKLLVVGDRSKAEICQEQGIDLFIEDYAVNARLIAARNVPVIILDATYNRLDLPENVIRCYNWGQIMETLRQAPQFIRDRKIKDIED